MSSGRLYSILGIACLAGYSWLFVVLNFSIGSRTLCPFKNLTGLACPSCGSTRGVLRLIEGDFSSAILLNPLSVVVALALIVIPFWIAGDLIFKSDSLHRAYRAAEIKLSGKAAVIIITALIFVNWLWNINKQL